ncbi:hypothetical protein A5674_13735 [Mycobacterium malmoense]|uniref:alpha/beta fold hydrolase n=1 Tax=Mycobacterium malmoense TaxID=1780 RepID=UPI00080BA1DD|nr:alpha/beta fold hydrolase [Mycobacterium malmoense]OCB30168.1 hypothetical protein A5674_13735 [Mycobacterium malmoense]
MSEFYSQAVQGPYEVFELGDFPLDEGGVIRDCQLAYTVFGELNPRRDNAILVTTWYSGTSKDIERILVGPGRALDPQRYFIIIVNQLGNGLSSSPHNTPLPASGPRFPAVRISDDVRAQHRLVTEKYGIERLALVLGGSMGGQQTWEWAVRFPTMVARAAPIASTAKTTSHSALFAEILIETITSDPAWNEGFYTSSFEVHRGLMRQAKSLALMGWSAEFFECGRPAELGFPSFDDFMTSFMFGYFAPMDPNNLVCMARKWQRHDVSRNTGGDLATALARITAKTVVMPISHDLMFPPNDCEAHHRLTPDSTLTVLRSVDGHMALQGLDRPMVEQLDQALVGLLDSDPSPLSAERRHLVGGRGQ